MKRAITLGAFFCILLCSGYTSAADGMADGFPDLPSDARKVAERYMACQHFWGELGGAGNERDREVSAQLQQLKCDRIEQDLAAIKQKYRDRQNILKILKEADFREIS